MISISREFIAFGQQLQTDRAVGLSSEFSVQSSVFSVLCSLSNRGNLWISWSIWS